MGISRHVRVIITGIGVGQVAGMVALTSYFAGGASSAPSVVDEFHLIGIPLQAAAEYNIYVVRAR